MLSTETLEFYRELRKNNNKEWFDQNRQRFEEVKKDQKKLVGEILIKMQQFDPTLSHLQAKDCIFRINRDIRFSNDKTPYKTHLGILMSPYGKKMESSGYYVHLDEQDGSFAGGGIYMPPGDTLKKIRREISDFYEDLEEVVHSKGFKETFGSLDRDKNTTLIRPPKGYDEDDPAIEYLKFKSFTATKELDSELLSNPDGVDIIVDILKRIKPLNNFINRGLRA